jgi:hypothetical protein
MRAAHALLFLGSAAAALVLAAPACVRQGAPVVAPVEIADVGDAGPARPLVVVAPPAAPQGRCTARLRASPIKTNAGCTLDERISKGDGVLLFPCSGSGELEAIFGEHHFRGVVTGDSLHLRLTTELDWDDGCHWETQQSIRGEWRREGPRPKLLWTYEEHPVQGTACFGACKARADIELDELTQ